MPTQMLFVFCCAFLLFLPLHLSGSFMDPDSFYHARLVLLMRGGPVFSFPWLPLTVLQTTYIDHHFLYHVFLIPFVSFFNPLVGITVATLLFATIFITLFNVLLRTTLPKVQGHFTQHWILLWTLLLLFNSTFIFRLNLEKIPAFSLILFFCGLWAILKNKLSLLFLLSFLYVWTYSGWPLLVGVACISSLTQSICEKHTFFDGVSWKIGGVSLLGALLGILIHPYFPTDLYFYWIQIGVIGFFQDGTIFSTSNEWLPAGFSIVSKTAIALIVFCVASTAFFIPSHQKSIIKNMCPLPRYQQWFLYIVSFLLLLFSIKSVRHIEYFVPVALFFSGIILIPLCAEYSPLQLLKNSLTKQKEGISSLLKSCLLFLIPCVLLINIVSIYTQRKNGFPFTHYKQVSAWLVAHTPANSLVFNDRWDDFPQLFFYNQHNQYISGLHPTFLALTHPELALMYEQIRNGNIPSSTIGSFIFNDFHASTVLIRKDNDKLKKILDESHVFTLKYQDSEALVYMKK